MNGYASGWYAPGWYDHVDTGRTDRVRGLALSPLGQMADYNATSSTDCSPYANDLGLRIGAAKSGRTRRQFGAQGWFKSSGSRRRPMTIRAGEMSDRSSEKDRGADDIPRACGAASGVCRQDLDQIPDIGRTFSFSGVSIRPGRWRDAQRRPCRVRRRARWVKPSTHASRWCRRESWRAHMHEGLNGGDIDDAALGGTQSARNACVTLNKPLRFTP